MIYAAINYENLALLAAVGAVAAFVWQKYQADQAAKASAAVTTEASPATVVSLPAVIATPGTPTAKPANNLSSVANDDALAVEWFYRLEKRFGREARLNNEQMYLDLLNVELQDRKAACKKESPTTPAKP